MTTARDEEIRELARTRLGFSELRPGQLRAVSAVADGRDLLAVLPTGAGKSAIYELTGMLREGPTVVVSPLIALQDDQLAHLQAAGLTAIELNSQQGARARAAGLAAAAEPDAFVFLSPEQLSNLETREVLRHAGPGLFVVDEAHLISQWGHDFRTDYMRLGAQADALEVPVRVALTATAAQPVRAEIITRLGLEDPEIVVGDFDRPHIYLSARGVRSATEKQRELVAAAAELGGSGIVYAATHTHAEEAHDALAGAGERVTLYHAGLPAKSRQAAMSAFLDGSARIVAATHASAQAARDVLAAAGERVTLYHAGLSARERRDAMAAFMDGSARIIAATVAFGMGIDKPDVRWVLHLDPPPSLDSYYQELGRAGRDEEPAEARLLYRQEDFGSAVHFTARPVSTSTLARVAADLEAGRAVEPTRRVTAALVRLVDLGAVTWDADGDVRWTGESTAAAAAAASEAETERELEVERSRLEMMRRYAEHGGCRRSFLLSYFGQDYPGRCGNCDNDGAGRLEVAATQPFGVGERVASTRWGEGTVQRYDGDQVTVLFDEHGYRDLLVPLVIERGLLRPAQD